ncbi:MAG TPA: patatin-like phospholipase family protein [Fimbriiglobus sp.]|nr:patatin-like phospholipase family protein [Fimbriiglobus sp.]
MTRTRTAAGTLLAALACALPAACLTPRQPPPSPTRVGLDTIDLIDPQSQAEADHLLSSTDIYRLAEGVRRRERPAPGANRTVLCLSGGGAYGAYSAGVLVGWSSTCTRPRFDVVTGISTGALIAPFAFLGPRYDPLVEHFYTTTKSRDLFRVRPLRALRSEAVADNSRLEQLVTELLSPEVVGEVAAEHARGRRLYVGTTELESRRFVVWDLGAVAAKGTEDDLRLFRQVVLASAAVPGFFPPVHIPVAVNGERLTERHVDGGVSQALFFRPPFVPPTRCADPAARSLAGTDVYAVVAGKVYPDPEPARARAVAVARNSAAGVIHAQTRGDLVRLWTICALTGMNYHMTAIPPEYPAPLTGTAFEPAEMTAMFEEGVRQVRRGTAWRPTPPGVEPGEHTPQRGGTDLVAVPARPPVPCLLPPE